MNKKMIRFEIKDNIWKWFLSLAVSLLAGIVLRLTMYVGDLVGKGISFYDFINSDVTLSLNYLTDYSVVFLIFYGIAIYFGLTMFSYLHKEEKLILYHSMPAKKENILMTKYFVGIGYLLVSYLITLFTVYGVDKLIYPDYTRISLEYVLMCLTYFLRFVLVYTVCLLANIIVGNAIYTFFGTGILLALPYMVIRILQDYMEVPYVLSKTGGIQNVYATLFLDTRGSQYLSASKYGILILELSVLIGGLLFYSVWLLKRRKVERVNHTIAFAKGEKYIRQIILFTFLSGTVIFFMYGWNRTISVLFIGLIYIVFVLVVEVLLKGGIFNIRIKTMALHLILSVLIFGGTIFIAKSNLLVNTYMSEQYIPDFEDVRFVALEVRFDRDYVFSQEEDVENIIELHKRVIDSEEINTFQNANEMFFSLTSFSYMLRNGEVVTSYYYVPEHLEDNNNSEIANRISAINEDVDYAEKLIAFVQGELSNENAHFDGRQISYGELDTNDLDKYPYREYQVEEQAVEMEMKDRAIDPYSFLQWNTSYFEDFANIELPNSSGDDNTLSSLYLAAQGISISLDDKFYSLYHIPLLITPDYEKTYGTMQEMIAENGQEVSLYNIYMLDAATRELMIEILLESDWSISNDVEGSACNNNFTFWNLYGAWEDKMNTANLETENDNADVPIERYDGNASLDSYMKESGIDSLEITTKNYENVYDKIIVPNYKVTKEMIMENEMCLLYDVYNDVYRFCTITDEEILVSKRP